MSYNNENVSWFNVVFESQYSLLCSLNASDCLGIDFDEMIQELY